MEDVLTVNFDEDSKAYEALTTVKELDAQGQIRLIGGAVVLREEDGRVVTKDAVGDAGLEGTASGGIIGLLIGILGGPLGVIIGGAEGVLIGSLFDLSRVDETQSVLTSSSQSVRVAHTALLVEVDEQSPEVIDSAMARLGGSVERKSLDEADALAQSRELGQMHHEDRAGVNALVRGVDDLATGNLPAVVIMCTNRLDALDPAVCRRAAVTFTFSRPNDTQRTAFLKPVLEELGFSPQQIQSLVTATGATHGRSYGYTYSDLAQRLLPGLLLAAYPSHPITFDLAKEVIERHPPTPPFRELVEGSTR